MLQVSGCLHRIDLTHRQLLARRFARSKLYKVHKTDKALPLITVQGHMSFSNFILTHGCFFLWKSGSFVRCSDQNLGG